MALDAAKPVADRQLETHVCDPVTLTHRERCEMFQLMGDHYENVRWESFIRDLVDKHWVVTIQSADRRILGFTTLMQLSAQVDGETIEALYSGDTVLDPEIWGSGGWARTWGRHVAELMSELGNTPLYWLLLTACERRLRIHGAGRGRSA